MATQSGCWGAWRQSRWPPLARQHVLAPSLSRRPGARRPSRQYAPAAAASLPGCRRLSDLSASLLVTVTVATIQWHSSTLPVQVGDTIATVT